MNFAMNVLSTSFNTFLVIKLNGVIRMDVITWCIVAMNVVKLATSINFNCWDESNQHKLTYQNNKDKLIEGLPTIRLFQGFYGSQWAMQYTAYVYLTEQLGVNVSWYPSDDHYILLNESFNRPDYPSFYFHWFIQDKADLLFELWHTAMVLAS